MSLFSYKRQQIDKLLDKYWRCCCSEVPRSFWNLSTNDQLYKIKQLVSCCGSISGYVGEDGLLAGEIVTLTLPDTSERTTLTNSEGYYIFCNLSCGDYVLSVSGYDDFGFTIGGSTGPKVILHNFTLLESNFLIDFDNQVLVDFDVEELIDV